jgi:hypothetical protein
MKTSNIIVEHSSNCKAALAVNNGDAPTEWNVWHLLPVNAFELRIFFTDGSVRTYRNQKRSKLEMLLDRYQWANVVLRAEIIQNIFYN